MREVGNIEKAEEIEALVSEFDEPKAPAPKTLEQGLKEATPENLVMVQEAMATAKQVCLTVRVRLHFV